MKTKAIFTTYRGSAAVEQVYSPGSRSFLGKNLDFGPPFYTAEDITCHADEWKDVEGEPLRSEVTEEMLKTMA